MTDKDELRAEIADTRDRMSDTLDELSVRLNPNRIKEQVRDNIREATIGRVENMARQAGTRVNETRDGILNTIRDNPVPAAMIGIGLGWLIFGNRRRDSEYHGTHDSHLHSDTGYIGDVSATTPRLIQDDAAGGIGGSVSHDHGNGVVSRVREHVSGIGDRVADVGGRVSDVRASVASRASTFVAGTTTRVSSASRTLQDTPLALGAVALAAGLAAGLAIPESEREAQFMGDQRDRLIDRAREAASDVKERARNIAERVLNETRENVTETVKEVARAEGLSKADSASLNV